MFEAMIIALLSGVLLGIALALVDSIRTRRPPRQHYSDDQRYYTVTLRYNSETGQYLIRTEECEEML